MLFRLPEAKRVHENPSPAEVKELAAKMPTARWTKYGNLNVQTEVLARSKRSTYLVTDDPDGQNQAISSEPRRASMSRRPTRTSPACSNSCTSGRQRTTSSPS